MFKRKKLEGEEQAFPSEEAPDTSPSENELRTTCYPQDGDPAPTVAGHPRTTVYRQSLLWTRRTYDTIN